MFGSTILDVTIGLAFLYFILSLMTTTLTELVARFLALRSNNLRRGIESLLNDMKSNQLAQEFYRHPLIAALSRRTWIDALFRRESGKPSYIPSEAFAKALVDIILSKKEGVPMRPLEEYADLLRKVLQDENVPIDPNVKCQLLIVLEQAKTAEEAYGAIRKWFDDMMDRVSGWYKRKVQLATLGVAVLVTLAVNADTPLIFNRMLNDPVLRDAVSSAAEEFVRDVPATDGQEVAPPGQDGADSADEAHAAETDAADTLELDATSDRLNYLQAQLNTFDLIGWSDNPDDPRAWPATDDYNAIASKIIGLLVTTVLVSLGAPFWFDILQRLTRIRATGDVSAGTYVPGTTPEPESSPPVAVYVSAPQTASGETVDEHLPVHDAPTNSTTDSPEAETTSSAPHAGADPTPDDQNEQDDEIRRRG